MGRAKQTGKTQLAAGTQSAAPLRQNGKAARLVLLPGLAAPLELRRKRMSRTLSLRINPHNGLVRVVAPLGISEAQIERFVMRHRDWVHANLDALPPRKPFVAGAVVPILGKPHVIVHDDNHRGTPVVKSDGTLVVGGKYDHLARRVRDYLVARARAEIALRARAYAGRLDKTVRHITLRDTRSRWGSCARGGKLSFSWRLIMSPAYVLDYVVAHEVSHLCEMNHSPSFWRICDRLVPDMERAKRWLRDQGAQLLRYG